MAKGFQQHQARMAQISRFGRELARRAKSKCEVCESAGVSLTAFEVPPTPEEADIDHCVFICATCQDALENPKKKLEPNEWRTLGNTIWSEVPAAQVAVVRLLRRIAKDPEGAWARELLEETYLDPEIEEWADKDE